MLHIKFKTIGFLGLKEKILEDIPIYERHVHVGHLIRSFDQLFIPKCPTVWIWILSAQCFLAKSFEIVVYLAIKKVKVDPKSSF